MLPGLKNNSWHRKQREMLVVTFAATLQPLSYFNSAITSVRSVPFCSGINVCRYLTLYWSSLIAPHVTLYFFTTSRKFETTKCNLMFYPQIQRTLLLSASVLYCMETFQILWKRLYTYKSEEVEENIRKLYLTRLQMAHVICKIRRWTHTFVGTRQTMYVWRNMEGRSCNYCCSGKAMSTAYPERVTE